MKVTILSVALNAEKTIARTIESVLIQTYRDIEYIILDGASSDKTVEIARGFEAEFEKTEGKTLQIITEPDNGMYEALNKGARLATGELVGQINADDWYEPDAVETMVRLYEKEHFDVAWGSILIHKPSGNMIKHARLGKLMTTTGWCHPGMFSRKEVLLKFPYPVESMYDDLDYMIAVRTGGEKVITIDQVIANYSFGGMSTKKDFKEVKHRVDSAYRIYRKYGLSRFYYFHKYAVELAKYILG